MRHARLEVGRVRYPKVAVSKRRAHSVGVWAAKPLSTTARSVVALKRKFFGATAVTRAVFSTFNLSYVVLPRFLFPRRLV